MWSINITLRLLKPVDFVVVNVVVVNAVAVENVVVLALLGVTVYSILTCGQ